MPAAGHGPAPLGLQVIGFRSWGRAMPCQRGRLTAFFNILLAGQASTDREDSDSESRLWSSNLRLGLWSPECERDRKNRLSKRNGLFENLAAQQMVEPLFLDDLDLPPQSCFKISQQAAREEWACRRPGLDQQIKVAVLPRFIARERTEHSDTRHSVSVCDCQDRFTLGCSQLIERHASNLLQSRSFKRRRRAFSETPEIFQRPACFRGIAR